MSSMIIWRKNMNEQQDDLDTHVVPLPLDITDP